jgi:hypothetical protein
MRSREYFDGSEKRFRGIVFWITLLTPRPRAGGRHEILSMPDEFFGGPPDTSVSIAWALFRGGSIPFIRQVSGSLVLASRSRIARISSVMSADALSPAVMSVPA